MSSMPGIYFAGLNSGIKWDTLISELVAIEHKKVDILIRKRNDLYFQKSTSLEVNQRLAKLDTALSKLRLESTFLSKKVTSSDETKLTAQAGVDAAIGNWQVSVERMARASTAQSGLNGVIVASGAYLGAGNTAGVAGLTAGIGFEPVRAVPETLFNDLTQVSNVTAGDTITVTGTDGNGNAVNEEFTFNGDSTDTLQRFAQFVVSSFNGTANVSIGYSGEIVVRQVAGSGTLSFDPVTNLAFTDTDYSGSALNFGAGVSYTDGSGNGYGATGPLTVRGTGVHELSFTDGKAGFVLSTGALSAEDTLENLGINDFSLTIDPDAGGAQVAVAISGLNGKTTLRGLIDLINYYVQDVTAYLDSTTGKLTIQSNEGGRNITVAGNLGGVTDILYGGNLTLNTSTPNGTTSFAATTNTGDYTVADRFSTEQGVTMIRKARTGSDGSAIANLIGGYSISGVAGHQFNAGVAVVKTSFSSELNTSPAMPTRLMGVTGVGKLTSVSSPRLNVANAISNANFAMTVTAGIFSINGVQFTIADTASTTVQEVIARVNSSAAGVVMEYDGANNRFVVRNKNNGPQSVTIGAGGDTSNFLAAARLRADIGAVSLVGRNKGTVLYESPLASAGFDSTPTTGIFTVNGVSIYIDSSTDSLKDVLNKINRSGAGVTATFSTATDTVTLVQNLDENTTANYIRIGSATDTSNFLQVTRFTTQPTVETEIGGKRQSAQFSVDGVSYSRPTNSPSDIIGGVKLNLLGVTNGTVNLTVEADSKPAVDALADFIAKWNETMEFLNPMQLTREEFQRTQALTQDQMNNMALTDIDAYNIERQVFLKRNFIANDRTVERTVTKLRNMMTGLVQNSGIYTSLTSIGIETSGAGEVQSAIESRGRFLDNTTDKDRILELLKGNVKLQAALRDNIEDVFTLFSNALASTARVEGTVNLNGGATLANRLRFTLGDGANTAQVVIEAGYHTMNSLGNQIMQQLAAGRVDGVNVSFGNSYNLILTNALTSGLRSQIVVQDLSQGADTILGKLGITTGTYFGAEPLVAGGLAMRSRSYINATTKVGGILFERTRSGGSFDRQINSLSEAIENGEESVGLFELRLRRKFAAMEKALTQYNAQSQQLSQYVTQLNNQGSSGSNS